ncbi:MAG: hypothetical protein M3P85_16465 [Actinomycetota bacterium]|nr:hypothetical protein [Actinomycetota bacterium]
MPPGTTLVGGVAIAAVGLFAYALAIHPARPGVLNPPGWYGFFDQSHYLDLARDLARANLPSPPSSYIYGLGYPALAVPFLKLRPGGDAFAIPDAIAFAAAMAMVAVLGRRLRSSGFGLACAAAVALATPLLDTMVVPWNTTVTVVAVLAALVVATSPGQVTWRGGLIIGLATGMAFAARYLDALFPALIGALALVRGTVGGRGRSRVLVAAAAGAVLVAIPVLATHAAVLGSPLKTPYSQQEGRQGEGSNQQSLSNFEPQRAPRNFLEVFVTGRTGTVRAEVDPIGRQFPWAALAPVGVAVLVRRRHRLALPLGAAFAVSVLGSAIYLSYPGGSGAHLLFGNIHYWKAWFPLWGVLAAYALAAAADHLARRPQREAMTA